MIFGVDGIKTKIYWIQTYWENKKDALDTLIANRDNALATLKKQRLDNLIDERKKYWKRIMKKYTIKYSDGVQDLLKGYNAKTNQYLLKRIKEY